MKQLAAIVAIGFMLAGCQTDQYLARTDAITLTAGDDQAVNTRAQEMDPWPAAAWNTRIEMSGQRAAEAAERAKQNSRPLSSGSGNSGGGYHAAGSPSFKIKE